MWWILWGIVGAMLAVPLTSTMRIICSDLISTGSAGYYVRVLNQLLEGRPLDSVDDKGRGPPSPGLSPAGPRGFMASASDHKAV